MYAILSGLLNGIILATALTAAVWIALRLTPRSTLNAATRYVIWLVTLAAAILLPLMFVPVSRAPKPAASRPFIAPTTAAPVHSTAPMVATRPMRPAAIPIPVPAETPVPKGLVFVWPALTLILLLRLTLAVIRLNCLKARACQCHLPRTEQWLAFCKGRRRGIRLALSAEIATPIATGPMRPTILFPTKLFEGLTEEDLDRIGIHETAHLVRRDDYALILQRIIEALFIPYPLIFWIARRIDLEREIACDDLVIAATGRPRSYAACLTHIVESCDGMGSPWPAATAAEDGSHLARRVDALLDKTRRAGAHLMKMRLAASTAVLAVLVLLTGKAPTLVAFVTTTVAAHAVKLLPTHRAPILPLPAQVQSTPREDLAGQVVEDGSGHPVLSAELRFRKAGMRELAADLETDPQGRFSAAGLPGGQYNVQVLKPNYESVTFQLSVPAPRLTVRLTRYGVIDGRATNMAGQPIPGIIRIPTGRAIGGGHVTILTKDKAGGRLTSVRDVPLEEEGHYRVFDLPPGEYAVGFWYSGVSEGAGMQLYPDTADPKFFTITGGEEYDHIDFTVTPRPTAWITGKLQLPEGMKKQFQLALGLPDRPNQPFAQLWSEEDGSFRFEKIPPGTYDLFAAGPVNGYGGGGALSAGEPPLFGRTRIQTSGQNIENLTVPLTTAKSARVIIRAQGSGPLPKGCPESTQVDATPLEPWYIINFGRAQASFGREQTIPNLPPGAIHFSVGDLGNGCYQTNDPVGDLRGDITETIVIEVAAAGAIHGVLQKGAPGSPVILTGSSFTGSNVRRSTYTDATGHFAFENLAPGRYRIAGKEIEVQGGASAVVEVNP